MDKSEISETKTEYLSTNVQPARELEDQDLERQLIRTLTLEEDIDEEKKGFASEANNALKLIQARKKDLLEEMRRRQT